MSEAENGYHTKNHGVENVRMLSKKRCIIVNNSDTLIDKERSEERGSEHLGILAPYEKHERNDCDSYTREHYALLRRKREREKSARLGRELMDLWLAGDEGGSYLPTQRGVEDKGYSASIFCNQVSYEGGQQLVEHTLGLLNEMKER